MPLQIIKNDITKVHCDAIVNAANITLLGGGGVDGAIHRAAGLGLLFECFKLFGCKTGEAKITKGYKLPCKFIIHTVGPMYKDGTRGEEQKLRSCYQKSLQLAIEHNCKSVAFPLISTGIYNYPRQEAIQIAIDVISNFIKYNDLNVYLVVLEPEIFEICLNLFPYLTKK